MSLFTDVMTVYNYIPGETGDSWQRSVIRGVQWSHNKTKLTVSGGVQTEKRVESITVDFGHDYGNPRYVDPVSFAKMEDKSCCWTLNEKDGQDMLVLGESDIEIGEDYRISDLFQEFQYCGTVTEVSDNRNRTFLKNIKVVAE